LGSQVSKGWGQVASNATNATAGLSEKAKQVQGSLKDAQSKGAAKLGEARAMGAARAEQARAHAAKAAGGVKGALGSVGSSLQGLTSLTMSPMKLAQFAGAFFLGTLLISLSFSFVVVAPQKFALLFAFGSMALLGSFALLKGPQAFFSSATARDKLPFSGAYAIGLVGTLVATIGVKSLILAAIFGLMQAVGLLYFVASYVPGGQAILNFCGKCCGKGARAIGGQMMRT